MKKIINIYLSAWRLLIKRKQIWYLLFIVNLFLAILLSIPFNGLLGSTVADTIVFYDSKFHFDFLMIGDFINNYKLGLVPIFRQSLVFIVLYYFLQVFFSGGILSNIKSGIKGSEESFWNASLNWFFDMFRVSFYALLAQAGVIALFVLFFVLLLGGLSPFNIENEGNMIVIFKIVLPFYLFVALSILCIRDYVKMRHITGHQKWLNKTIPRTTIWVFRHIHFILPLFLLHILSFILVNYIYQWIMYALTGDRVWMLFGMFLLVQLFIFIRLGIRIVHLISVRLLNEQIG